MKDRQLAQIEYRWTEGHNDCADLEEVFEEVRRLRQERDEARSLLKQASSYLGGHPSGLVYAFEQNLNHRFVQWADADLAEMRKSLEAE